MKYALITDMHFGARNDSLLFLDYYEKFYSETFFPTLLKEKIEDIIILGDTFDRRKYVNYQTLQRSKKMFFDVCARYSINVYMLVGNHDTYFKNTNDVNSIDLLLSSYENIVVLDRPRTENGLCFIPWICTDNYEDCMEELKNTKAKHCFGHFEIEGFAMYRGMHCEEGLSRDLFRKFSYTFSGHYHHKSSKDGIHYLGNPYQLTWSDYGDVRGFHIFDTDTEELVFYSNPNEMFQRLVYDDSQEVMTNPDWDGYKDKYIKVIVVNKTNPYMFDRFIETLYSKSPADLKIVEDFSDITEGLDEEMIDQAEDTLTTLNKYIDSIPTDNIDNSKLKSIFRELYLEALNTV